MEPYIVIAFIFLGAFFAFCSTVISSLSQENLNDIVESNNEASDRLHHIKIHFEEASNAFLIFESFSYLISVAFFTRYYNNNNIKFFLSTDWFAFFTLIVIFFIVFLLIRIIFVSIGKRFASVLALPFTPLLALIISIGKPILYILGLIESKISGKEVEEASREEINALFETAHHEGSIEAGEYRILKNIMHFSEVMVSDVMTPRTVIYSLNADITVAEVLDLPELQMHSRFPIWEGKSVDDGIVGYVMTKDILQAALKDQREMKLREFAREVYIIPENAELDIALDKFLKRRQHLFVVVDEYGGIAGLITMEDVLETILGVEIVDEADRIVDMRDAAKQRRDKRIAGLAHKEI
jgi:CBS domain containing-hemolysin-like protein